MQKRILIIHGWGSNSREHWFLEEKERLEKFGYEVLASDMPNALYPKQSEWVAVINNFNPDEDSVIIGHSLGGTTILRFLEETQNKVGRCIFIATPIRKLGLGYEGIENFLERDFDWEEIKKHSGKFVVLNQTEDLAVPLEHGKDLAKYLDAELVVVDGNDHFDKIDFSLLEKHILS